MRLLNVVNRSLDGLQCKSLGIKCGKGGDHIHEIYDELISMKPISPFPRSGLSTSKYHTAFERRSDLPKANRKMFAPSDTEDEFDSPKVGSPDAVFRTIPPSPRGSHTIAQNYCT